MTPQKLNRELRVGGRTLFYGIYDTVGSLCLILLVLLIYPWVWLYALFIKKINLQSRL